MKIGFAYSRKSIKIGNLSEEESIGYQQSFMENYGSKNDIIIKEHFSDVGYSGRNTNRPDLLEMLNKIKHSIEPIDFVLFYSIDRLGRELGNNINILMEILDKVPKVIFVVENLSSDSKFFKPMFLLFSGVSVTSWENLKRNIVNGKRAKVLQRKNFNGTIIPLGYTREKGEKKHARLIPATKFATENLSEQQGYLIVQHIFHCFLLGVSLKRIAQSINNHFGPSRKGRKWDYSSVRYILKNEIYTGTLKGVLNNNEYYFLENANVEPLIDPFLFEFIQQSLNNSTKGRKSEVLYRLSNFTLCKNCLTMLSVKKQKLQCTKCKIETDFDQVEAIIQRKLLIFLNNDFKENWKPIKLDIMNKFEIKKTNLTKAIIDLEKRKEKIYSMDDSVRQKRMLAANTEELMKLQKEYFKTELLFELALSLTQKDMQHYSKQSIRKFALKLPYLILIDFSCGTIDIVFHQKPVFLQKVGV